MDSDGFLQLGLFVAEAVLLSHLTFSFTGYVLLVPSRVLPPNRRLLTDLRKTERRYRGCCHG